MCKKCTEYQHYSPVIRKGLIWLEFNHDRCSARQENFCLGTRTFVRDQIIFYFTDMDGVISVFIIDDDPDDQVLMKQALEAGTIPVQVRFASKSEDALSYLANCDMADQPDIIISDYNMPMMNGEEFLGFLRKQERYLDTPKVILSTAASPAIIQACMTKGASRYLIKPSDFSELIKLTNEIILLANSTNKKTNK